MDQEERHYLKGLLHCDCGPAVRHNKVSYWFVEGHILDVGEAAIARKVLSEGLTEILPLLLSHPRLKYFAQYVLSGSPPYNPVKLNW